MEKGIQIRFQLYEICIITEKKVVQSDTGTMWFFNGLIYRCFTLDALVRTTNHREGQWHDGGKYCVSSTLGRRAAHRCHQFCWSTSMNLLSVSCLICREYGVASGSAGEETRRPLSTSLDAT
jgi:hypothetical protein